MSKERISATVDSEVDAYLSRESVNASGLINKLVKQQMSSGGDNEELVKLRLEQVNSEIDRHKNQVETLEKERKSLRNRLDEIQSEQQSQRQETLEKLETVPWKPDNPAIKTNAQDLNMEPQALIQKLEEYHAE